MLKELTRYIVNKNWTLQREGERFLFYKPPFELGFDDKYLLPVPKESSKDDFNSILNETIKLISEIYKVDPNEITHDITDYFETLKNNAIYFKLNSENVMFQQTLEVNDIWNFLKNLSTSYTNYLKIEFAQKFYPIFGADNDRIKRALPKLVDLTRLRVVALEYASFNVGVSADNLMGKHEIEIKEIQEWRGQVINNYKKDVIDMDFNNIESVDKILEKFNEEERRKIYEPLVSSINNSSDFNIIITDSAFTPKRKLKRIPSLTVDVLMPKSSLKEAPKKKVGLYRTILTIDENKPSVKLKRSDLEEDSLFTEKLEGVSIKITKLTYRDNLLYLKSAINCDVNVNENEDYFVANIRDLNVNINVIDFNNLQNEIDEAFSKMIDYYYFKEKPIDEKGMQIWFYLHQILPDGIKPI